MIYIYSLKAPISLCMLFACSLSIGQINQPFTPGKITVNGHMSIGQKGVFSSNYPFIGLVPSQITSYGTTYFYNDFHNDGDFQSKENKAHTIFKKNDSVPLVISGESIISFYGITWDSNAKQKGFVVKSNLDVHGPMEFVQGIVYLDKDNKTLDNRTLGALSVYDKSSIENASDNSHIDGSIEKIGKHSYLFPIGDKGLYRPLILGGSDCPKDVFSVKYSYQDHDFFSSRENKSSIIKYINKQEFWAIDKAQGTSGSIVLSLSLDTRTFPDIDLTELSIVQWNNKLEIWQDYGGILEANNTFISALVHLQPDTSYFTLARVDKESQLPGDILVYNFVSANNDGKNDFLYIQNIHRYPINQVEIFDRWGVRVFSQKQYDKYADGTTNVFTGHYNGNSLPSGTYYYIIKYQIGQAHQQRSITKSGSLHLETF